MTPLGFEQDGGGDARLRQLLSDDEIWLGRRDHGGLGKDHRIGDAADGGLTGRGSEIDERRNLLRPALAAGRPQPCPGVAA